MNPRLSCSNSWLLYLIRSGSILLRLFCRLFSHFLLNLMKIVGRSCMLDFHGSCMLHLPVASLNQTVS